MFMFPKDIKKGCDRINNDFEYLACKGRVNNVASWSNQPQLVLFHRLPFHKAGHFVSWMLVTLFFMVTSTEMS